MINSQQYAEQNPFISCQNLVKIYKIANLEVIALQGLDLEVGQGEIMALVAGGIEIDIDLLYVDNAGTREA